MMTHPLMVFPHHFLRLHPPLRGAGGAVEIGVIGHAEHQGVFLHLGLLAMGHWTHPKWAMLKYCR